MRHLAGIGCEQAAHRITGVASQRVALLTSEAVVAHFQVVHAAGTLQAGKCREEILGFVRIGHSHHARHLHELFVAGMMLDEEAVELVRNHDETRTVRQVVVIGTHGVFHRMLGRGAGELHRKSGYGASVGNGFTSFQIVAVLHGAWQVFGDVFDGRKGYRLAQHVDEAADHYLRVVEQRIETLIGGVRRRYGAHQFRIDNRQHGIEFGVAEPDFLIVAWLEITPQQLISEAVPDVVAIVTMGSPGCCKGSPLPVPPWT